MEIQMHNFIRTLVLAPVLAASFMSVPAQAQYWPTQGNPQPNIAVPDRPQPNQGLNGCYRLDSRIYGPYRVSFCLQNRNSSYEVQGGGLNCEAGLTWFPTRNGATIQLNRARSCGRGMSWTADTIECRVAGRPGFPGWGNPWGQQGPRNNQMQPNIAVPENPGAVRSLNCTYYPAVRGYPPRQVTAVRV
jgi:hypothetical protein